jgi:hypothetical protein
MVEKDEDSGDQDEEIDSDDYDPFSEDSGTVSEDKRVNKRKKDDVEEETKDISDEETVVTSGKSDEVEEAGNQQDDSKGWTEVRDKKHKGTQNNQKRNIISEKEKGGLTQAKLNFGKGSGVSNPYYRSVNAAVTSKSATKQQEKTTSKETNVNSSAIPSYLEAVTHKKRKANKFNVRCNFSWTPRIGNVSDFKRAAIELLAFAESIDPSVMLLAWKGDSENGPINSVDLMNPKNYIFDIVKYIDKPPYAPIQPGVPIYRMGVFFSISIDKYTFVKKWNLKRQQLRKDNLVSHAITLAPMQNSYKAYLIGIAAGSTENQDCDLLNERLAAATGIKGIETSFQNINQTGITQDFWKIANKKALAASENKNSRAHLQCKYKWAPNALAIFVPEENMVDYARQVMIQMYGKFKDQDDPIWPDGSKMRFLPLKSGVIKSDSTRELVRKRFAYHIWMKAHEVVIPTNMINIHNTRDEFEGRTFAEIVLAQTYEGKRIMAHFKRVWHQDPAVTRWGISVQTEDSDAANLILSNLMDSLEERYGSVIRGFFLDKPVNTQEPRAMNNSSDEGWFKDDAFKNMISAGIFKNGFIQFLKGEDKDDETDKDSVDSGVSWGTGDTNYTDVVAPNKKDIVSTDSSTITPDSGIIVNQDEIESRRQKLRSALQNRKLTLDEIEEIMSGHDPYGMIVNGIILPAWNLESSIIMVLAIREYYSQKPKKKNE